MKTHFLIQVAGLAYSLFVLAVPSFADDSFEHANCKISAKALLNVPKVADNVAFYWNYVGPDADLTPIQTAFAAKGYVAIPEGMHLAPGDLNSELLLGCDTTKGASGDQYECIGSLRITHKNGSDPAATIDAWTRIESLKGPGRIIRGINDTTVALIGQIPACKIKAAP